MRRTVFTDPFFYNQPPLSFIEELKKPLHDKAPEYYGKREIEKGEIDVQGLFIAEKFENDPENLLETIYTDFALFLDVYGISDKKNKFPIYLKCGETECFEAYVIEITEREIIITANDTEGIRRALIYLEDELRRSENAFLTPGTVKRKPFIRSRITRCFFSPINRAPKFGDELTDDIDYYPEEYLNRLMHEGSNGVWIYTRYSDLVPSAIIKEFGKGHEKRIAKLNRVIERCRRYGIGVYVFAIEPACLEPEIAEKYPDMAGTRVYNGCYSLCCSSELGKAYCYDAGKKLLELAPKLRGLISITFGERPTSCSTTVGGLKGYTPGPHGTDCPRCKDKKNGEILALALEALRSGAREINPDFETVSWTYGHRVWEMDDIMDYVDYAPEDVMLMQNFEDLGVEKQLGKDRLCEDYWLSYVGPSDLFIKTAERAKKLGKHMFAKMQVCCSHEIATVPYVPTPGIIFDKYAASYEYGVEGVMQCWYFGNYPSLMSKAAGEMSFASEFTDKDAFLERLAGIYFGRTKAKLVKEAWKLFESGYKNYPMNILFGYYGPMHDSVCWKMSLLPKNFAPARTWQLVDPVDGDRINDTLLAGHTLEEAIILCDAMRNDWNKGMEILSGIKCEHSEELEQLSVAGAVGILFDGGTNILEFYKKRDDLGRKVGDATKLLSEMRELILLEKQNSEKMIPLCEACPSLGYHSETEGYKFFPEKIRDRIEQLDELLATEFPLVEKRIAQGKSPLEYYDGVEDHDTVKRYNMPKCDISEAPWENIGDNADYRFRMSHDGNKKIFFELYAEKETTFLVCPEYRLTKTDVCVVFNKNGLCPFEYNQFIYDQMFGEKMEKEIAKYRNCKVLRDAGVHLIFTLDIDELGLDRIRPMKMKIATKIVQGAGLDYKAIQWCSEPERELRVDTMPKNTLAKPHVVPEDYGWIIPV